MRQLTNGEHNRYEKEFDNVQDVFELQVNKFQILSTTNPE